MRRLTFLVRSNRTPVTSLTLSSLFVADLTPLLSQAGSLLSAALLGLLGHDDASSLIRVSSTEASQPTGRLACQSAGSPTSLSATWAAGGHRHNDVLMLNAAQTALGRKVPPTAGHNRSQRLLPAFCHRRGRQASACSLFLAAGLTSCPRCLRYWDPIGSCC